MGKHALPPAKDHKVPREAKAPLAPPPVRILLEPPLQSQDDFELRMQRKPFSAEAKSRPIATRVKVGSTGHVIIEFELIRDKTIYQFIHSRGPGGSDGPEREIIEGKLPSQFLTDPAWLTPGEPSTTPLELDRSKINSPKRKAPPANDKLLLEDVTNFQKIRVEEPKPERSS